MATTTITMMTRIIMTMIAIIVGLLGGVLRLSSHPDFKENKMPRSLSLFFNEGSLQEEGEVLLIDTVTFLEIVILLPSLVDKKLTKVFAGGLLSMLISILPP